MLQIIGLIVFFIVLVLSGVSFVHLLCKKGIFINRWYFGFGAFLIILIPSFFFQQVYSVISIVFYLISSILAIMFFETTRLKLENNEFRGVVRSEQYPSKKD